LFTKINKITLQPFDSCTERKLFIFVLLGSNAMQLGEKPKFQRNIQPLSLGPKSKPSKIPAEAGRFSHVQDKASFILTDIQIN
jgi:hypothetical protein